jgi:site-specific DNA-methyltransferase (adenine-specific)
MAHTQTQEPDQTGRRVCLALGDCRDILKRLPDNSIDAVVTDPPYNLTGARGRGHTVDHPSSRILRGFLNTTWDANDAIFDDEFWRLVLRVVKPGGHLIAFGAPRTYHRLACAIEDADWSIRDCLMWMFASGFPKSKSVALSLDKLYGHSNRGRAIPTASRYQNGTTTPLRSNPVGPYEPKTAIGQHWNGWGTGISPSYEPICLARKPLEGTLAENIVRWGTGGLNVDACRIGTSGGTRVVSNVKRPPGGAYHNGLGAHCGVLVDPPIGRWPSNVMVDEDTAQELELAGMRRFFYCPKTSRAEREAGCERLPATNVQTTDGYRMTDRHNTHPTVKPVSLMRWLVKLVTPPLGTVLDPFMGSGTTGIAAALERCYFLGFERDASYVEIARARLAHWEPE